MAPAKSKNASKQSRESSRQTRAKYHALPENLPGLKTRSGKQISESPKTDRKPIQTPKAVKNQDDKKKATNVEKKLKETPKNTKKTPVKQPLKKIGKKEGNVKKKESLPDEDELHRNKRTPDVKDTTRSSSRTPQSKRTNADKTVDSQKSPRKPLKSATVKLTVDDQEKTTPKTNNVKKAPKRKIAGNWVFN